MLILRVATEDDAKVLFEWRNDPSVYVHCFNPEPVSWTEHLQWLQRTLADPHRSVFIVLNETGERIGQVRFDTVGDTAEINVAIGQQYRGRGYGFSTIKESAESFLREHQEVKKIIARVREENTVSIYLFRKVGFILIHTKEGVLHFELPRTNHLT